MANSPAYDDDIPDEHLFDEPTFDEGWRSRNTSAVQEPLVKREPLVVSHPFLPRDAADLSAPPSPLDADATRDLKSAQTRLGDALPKDGWLTDFVRMMVPMTSSPTEFHLAAGLAALSSALGNRIKDKNWGISIYPNLWQLVVAPSGNWHKTTSMVAVEDLLELAGANVMLPNDFSRESLLTAISEKPDGLLTFGEFASLLQTGRKDFGQGISADLTSLFDGRKQWTRKLQSKTYTIRRPAFNIYSGSTIDWLEDLLSDAELRSGFVYRFLFCTARHKNTERLTTGDPDRALQNRLVGGLRRVIEVAPTIRPDDEQAEAVIVTLTDEAKHAWEEFVRELTKVEESGSHATNLLSFFPRYQTYARKLAMLYRMSACAFDSKANPLIIDLTAMQAAIAYVRLCWKNTTHMFENEWAGTKEAKELRQVSERIPKGGIWQTEVMRGLHMKKFLFSQCLETLLETEEIVREPRLPSDLGLVRERGVKANWLSRGPKHPEVLALTKDKPKVKQGWRLEQEQEWDEAVARENAIVATAPSTAKPTASTHKSQVMPDPDASVEGSAAR
jgi:hypothetical protein